ncbi:MAG TPA: 23S rRNA (uracil(1939)-C(5))-methyltransferase RlmD, partial [Elusimicrobiota bacterium]|nr:23S rRNA (uracil(1939)-C(5))-methyltransferase RlmD [Elusimicrobiota bacterium]
SRYWIESLQEQSPHRAAPPCPYFFRPGAAPAAVCGGCDWQHLSYDYQLLTKRKLVEEALQRIGRIGKPPVSDTVPVNSPAVAPADAKRGDGSAWRYRNKVQIPFTERDGRLTAGFYAPGSHHIVPFEDCLVQTEESVRVFRAVREWFLKNPVQAYDQDARRGWLRHLLVRTNAKGEALAALVTNGPSFPHAVEFSRHLTAACPFVVSLFQNVNVHPGNVVLGPEWRHLHGKRYLAEEMLRLKFRLSPGSFFQVHHAMAEKLYRMVESFAAPNPQESVLELYAGVGAIAQMLAKNSRFVWAVEENPQAVEDAIASAGWNNLRNVRFLLGRCETSLARGRFRKGMSDRLGTVVLDPPRAGCEQHVLRALMRLEPKKIVYVSCDPATLARDARYLVTGGYHLRRCTPVDLFPQTSHIESVSEFTK